MITLYTTDTALALYVNIMMCFCLYGSDLWTKPDHAQIKRLTAQWINTLLICSSPKSQPKQVYRHNITTLASTLAASDEYSHNYENKL